MKKKKKKERAFSVCGMADVIKFSCNSQSFSSSTLASFSSSLNSCQRALPPHNQGGLRRGVISVSEVSSVGCTSVSPIVLRPREQFGSFKVNVPTFLDFDSFLVMGLDLIS